jgi:hypothetical protein
MRYQFVEEIVAPALDGGPRIAPIVRARLMFVCVQSPNMPAGAGA